MLFASMVLPLSMLLLGTNVVSSVSAVDGPYYLRCWRPFIIMLQHDVLAIACSSLAHAGKVFQSLHCPNLKQNSGQWSGL